MLKNSVLLLAILAILFVCLVLILLFWRPRPFTLATIIHEETPQREMSGILLGLLSADLLAYVLWRSTLPRNTFYLIVGSINLLFIVYLSTNVLEAWWGRRTGRRTHPLHQLDAPNTQSIQDDDYANDFLQNRASGRRDIAKSHNDHCDNAQPHADQDAPARYVPDTSA